MDGTYEKIKFKIKNKSITHNMFRIQDDDSIIYGFYCIDFMEYMIVRKALLDYVRTIRKITK